MSNYDETTNQQPTTTSSDDEQVITSVKTFKLSKDLECTIWDNGAISVYDPLYYYLEDESLPHLYLTNTQARAFRKKLNKPNIKQLLGIPSLPQAREKHSLESPVQGDEPGHVIDLGQHAISLPDDGSLVIGSNDGSTLELDPGEKYRLYVSLREEFQPGKGE